MSRIETKDRTALLDAFSGSDQGHGGLPAAAPAFNAPAERMFGAQQVAVYRDEARVLQKLKVLAAAAGEDWYYRFPVKNNKTGQTDWIEGPSIKLANDLSRLYGNCEIDTRVTDLGDTWVIYSRFIDYETGYALTRPFQQRKNASKMGGDEGRRLDIAFQIGVSKSNRNVVVNALQTYADYAFSEAKNSLVDRIGKDLAKWRDRTVEGLGKQGADMLTRAETMLGRKAKDWLAGDVAQVIAIMKAIADGMATWDESFPASNTAIEDGKAEKSRAPRKETVKEFAEKKASPDHDPETGEIQEEANAGAATESENAAETSTEEHDPETEDADLTLLERAQTIALQGTGAFLKWRNSLTEEETKEIKPSIERLKAAAKAAEAVS